MTELGSIKPNIKKWREILLARGVSTEFSEYWSSLSRANVPIEQVAYLPASHKIGTSKFGGMPDLESLHDWPTLLGQRLTFLAQLNLEELSEFGTGLPLPTDGILQFFYDSENQPWGFDPQDIDGFCVRYVEKTASLNQLDVNEQSEYPAVELKFSQSDCLPDWSWLHSHVVENKIFTLDEVYENFDKLEEDDLLYELANPGDCIGGWASLVQNPWS